MWGFQPRKGFWKSWINLGVSSYECVNEKCIHDYGCQPNIELMEKVMASDFFKIGGPK